MRTTIDKAGRVVIPAAIRERAGFRPGAEVEITEEEAGIRLRRVAPGPRVVIVGRRRVVHPTVPADQCPRIDIVAVVEDERNRGGHRQPPSFPLRAPL
jgi:AbrB family looped-hinge helix DNA binding protein